MVNFRLELKCSGCGAEIEYRNVQPEWKEDPKVAAELAESKAFIERHKDRLPRHVEETKPPFVISGRYDFKLLKVDPRYVDCPCCSGGRAWCGSGKAH